MIGLIGTALGILALAWLRQEGHDVDTDEGAREALEYAFPDLLTFHDALTPIEQRLFVTHLERGMRGS